MNFVDDEELAEQQESLKVYDLHLSENRQSLTKEIITGEWGAYQDFIRYNPLAATFDWSDLCIMQETDQANGRTSWAQSHAKWKIYHHTRFRVLSRERWTTWMENSVRRKLRDKISAHDQLQPNEPFAESRNWHDHFPNQWTAERLFSQWYAIGVAQKYYRKYKCTVSEERQVALEFGFRESPTYKWKQARMTNTPHEVPDPGVLNSKKGVKHPLDDVAV